MTKIKNQKYISKFKNFGFWIIILQLFGCATAPLVSPTRPEGIPGIYHRVETGQTLWRISKIYNIDLDEIVRMNRISDATNIETGQLIFIPYRQKKESVSSKYSLSDDFIWPMNGRIIVSFGQNFNNMINKGINIKPPGLQDVVASRRGKVVFYSDDFKGYGKTIIIDHGDGFLTVYAGNSQVLTNVGENVQQRALIAKVDTCLHFEIRKSHIAQNPHFYLP